MTICFILLFRLIFSLAAVVYCSFSERNVKYAYTSFQCIGGSQMMDTESMRQAVFLNFPLNSPEHRTCLFRNICIINGTVTYYISDKNKQIVPPEYYPLGFDGGNMFHSGHLRGFTMPIETKVGPIPNNAEFHHSKVAFLDAVSWSFNYGHYMIDNVIPTYIASRVFNIPYAQQQQVMETRCRQIGIFSYEQFAYKMVDYDRSMGTYHQACLAKVEGLHHYFFDNAPLYIDEMKAAGKDVCFKQMIGGQGSTFGLKSLDLSRAVMLRDFRDFVLDRMQKATNYTKPFAEQENLILVAQRTQGTAGGTIIPHLCEDVKKALDSQEEHMGNFKVECFTPSRLSFEEEIRYVRRAKILVSIHGTISYVSLFSRDGTQQISIASPKELKENQMLLSATHFNTLYLTWDQMHKFPALLRHSMELSDAYFEAKS